MFLPLRSHAGTRVSWLLLGLLVASGAVVACGSNTSATPVADDARDGDDDDVPGDDDDASDDDDDVTHDGGGSDSSGRDAGTRDAGSVDAGSDGGIVAPSTITQFSRSGGHMCARVASGLVYCAGKNVQGEVDGSKKEVTTPVQVQGLSNVADVSVWSDDNWTTGFSCARDASGAVFCWGGNARGRLGDGTTTSRSTPAVVGGLTAKELKVSGSHACARRVDDTVVCWGGNQSGELGDGTNVDRFVPTPVSGLTDVVELALGPDFSCARRSTGSVACWGGNGVGQLGDGTTTSRSTPSAVIGLTDAVSISGGSHVCARRSGGSVACWGNNYFGQLGNGLRGNGAATNPRVPVTVSGLSGVTSVAAGGGHSCAMTATGTYCWGSNSVGQLDGTRTDSFVPVKVNGVPASATSLYLGGLTSCVFSSGTTDIACWGRPYPELYGRAGFSSQPALLTGWP